VTLNEPPVAGLCTGRTLIALCGAPASGKTTLADQCADIATVVSVDKIRDTGRGGALDPYGPKATRRAFNAAYRMVDEALKRDQPAVLDSTASSRQARASILRLAAKHGAACHLIVLDVPLETLLERNGKRDDPCPEDVLRKLHGTLTAGLAGIGGEGFSSVSVGGEGRFLRADPALHPAPSGVSLPEAIRPRRQARERERERRRDRPNATDRGYDYRHKMLRRQIAPEVEAGGVACARCGLPIAPGTPWDLGHDDFDRSRYSGPEHRRCNRATAGRREETGLGSQSRRW
jgi:predicted kinase